MFAKKCYPKLKKIEKMISNLKSLEDKLRTEMPKNAVVHIKRGWSRDQTQEVSVARSLEAKPVKKALLYFLQIHLRFPSPVTTREP